MSATIWLRCKCGFRTDRASIGSVSAWQHVSGEFTMLAASFDVENSQIVQHSLSIPKTQISEMSIEEVDHWFETELDAKCREYGNLLAIPRKQPVKRTEFDCPNCGASKLMAVRPSVWL